jgi:hypothetical protein
VYKEEMLDIIRSEDEEEATTVSFYPVCAKFSKVMQVPEDVQPDWLAGAIEFLEFALASPGMWWQGSFDLTRAKQKMLCERQLSKLREMENDKK